MSAARTFTLARHLVCRFSRRLLPLALALLAPLLLGGCWTLEHYMATVRIDPDGGYRYFLEGTAVHTAAAMGLRRADYEAKLGKAKAEDIQKMRADAEALLAKDLDAARKDKRVQTVQAISGGRVRFMLSGKASLAGGEVVFMDRGVPLSYSQLPDGALSVRVMEAVVGPDAAALGLKVSGDLTVTVGKGVEVLENNADRTPSGPGGSYRWHIEKPGEPPPRLVIRLPKQ